MKTRSSWISALVAGFVYMLGAGAGLAQGGVEQRAPQPRIYAVGEINPNGYEIVGRLWADSWRSAFWVPTFPSQEQAVAALQTEAARRGANGLLNVNCLEQGHWFWSSSREPAFLCYGIAIRVRPS